MGNTENISIDDRKKLRQLQREFGANGHDIYILGTKDLTELWLGRAVSDGTNRKIAEQNLEAKVKEWGVESLWNSLRETNQVIATHTSTALDVRLLNQLARDLSGGGGSILTKYRISNYNGRSYLIFSGNHRARKIITGTRYLASNTKIINIGVGRLGATRAVVSGVRLTIILTVTFRAIDTLLRDKATWHDFIGGTATDLVKVATAGAAAFTASAWVAGGAAVGTIAVGPLFAAIAVGFAVGFVLEKLDEKTGFTQAIIKSLRDSDAAIRRDLREAERQWNWYHRSPEASVDFWMRVFGAQW